MALTQQQAEEAGVIAAQISALQAALSAAQSALSSGMFITSHGLNLMDTKGKKTSAISSQYQLGTNDSVTILNTLMAAYQSSIAALSAQLAGM